MKKALVILIASILGLISTFNTAAYAQDLKHIKEQGPLFITSVSFYHGFARIPYTPKEGENEKSTEILTQGLPVVNISQFMGYQFNPYVCLGVGVSFDYWTIKNAFLPVYVDFRVNMAKNRFAPQWYINLGYASRWHIDSKPYKIGTGNTTEYIIHGAKSGWMAETGFGLKVNVNYSTALIISAFAHFQESSLRYYAGSTKPSQNIRPLLVNADQSSLYISLGIKAGIAF